MLIPVRCYTCNKVIGPKWRPFQERCKLEMQEKGLANAQQIEMGPILNDMGLTCSQCRVIFMTNVTITSKRATRI